MIISGGGPLSPKVYLEMGNVEVDYSSVSSVVLDLCENKHDVLTIQLAGIPPKAITDYIDAPVRFTASIGQGRRVVFCGYVLYIEPEFTVGSSLVNGSPFQVAQLVCFGASINMKSSKTRVWENISTHTLGKTLAEEYGFSAEIINDGFYLPKVIQAKESDWQFLSNYCGRYGYSMSVNGTHLRIWDPFKAIGHRPSYDDLLSPMASQGPTIGGIITFKGTFGYLTPEGSSWNYSIDSMDNSGKIIKTTGDHNSPEMSWSGMGHRSKFFTSMIDSSLSPAESYKVIGAEIRENLPFTASVDVHAGIGTLPGGVVSVSGYQSNFEGLWYVRSVRHTFGGNTCITNLRLARDFNVDNSFLIPPSELSDTPPDERYIDGEWRTSVEQVKTYV